MKINACHKQTAARPLRFRALQAASLFILLLSAALTQSQSITIAYRQVDSFPQTLIKNVWNRLPQKAVNVEAANRILAQVPGQLSALGFLAASVDSVIRQDSSWQVLLFSGPQYKWVNLAFDRTLEPWMPNVKFLHASPDSVRQYVLDLAASKGYPFAQVRWQELQIDNEMLSGSLAVDTGQLYVIDSIAQNGNSILKEKFLYSYLRYYKRMPYRPDAANFADEKFAELPYVQLTRPSELQLLGTGAVLNTYLQSKKANQLDVLLGVMPQSTQRPDGKFLFTADVNAVLQNSFGNGELIRVNWQQLQYKSPRINLQFTQPFLFTNRAGIDFNFSLFKKDTQFLNLQTRVGIPYTVTSRLKGLIFFQYQKNTVSITDSNFVIATNRLPDLQGFSLGQIGLQSAYRSTDYVFNPTTGYELEVMLSAGLKNVLKDQRIMQLKDASGQAFSYLYDSLKLKTYQARLVLAAAKYVSVSSNAVVKLALNSGILQSGNYFRNELFQIGGFKLLRGFDEESIYSRAYGVGTVEYRLLAGANSFLFGFVNGGLSEYRDQNLKLPQRFLGFGAGMSLRARNSQVNISWAAGMRNGASLDLRQSKIHLGILNFF